MNHKKSVLGPVISVFVLILIVSILSGLTFLFVSQLKNNVVTTVTPYSYSDSDSSAWINSSGYTLDGAGDAGFSSVAITWIFGSDSTGIQNNTVIAAGNYSLSTAGVITNTLGRNWSSVIVNYTYNSVKDTNAYLSVNKTEAAGYSVVNYLSLIFLAVIFGAILTLVLKIIVPYINLGKSMDGF